MAGITEGARGEITFSDFSGVDFSSSVLSVDKKRASSARNFVRDGGKMRKRHGWRQVAEIKHVGQAERINGVFEYVNGDCREVIVHAGKRLYRVATYEDGRFDAVDITESGTDSQNRVDPERIKDMRSQAFLQGKKMYITGIGDFLVYGSFDGGESYELRRVYDGADTYIPKTTINVGYVGTATGGDEQDVRASLDYVNYMTGWRRNGITGLTTERMPSGKKYARYYVDTTIDAGTVVTVKTINEEYTYRNDPTSDEPNKLKMVTKDGALLSGNYGEVDYEGSCVVYATTQRSEVNGTTVTNWEEFDVPGMSRVGGEDVAEITFYHADADYEGRICNCSFGILFGAKGNTDRLFLSGNDDFPNVDFFSAADDYTYFEDVNTVTMGSDSYRTLGYARLADNTLAIFKEKSQTEASVFYRTGYYTEYYTDSGAIDEVLSVFPTTAGNVGETLISRYAVSDLGGDVLMLSENGVYGIVLTDNVATATRYTRERSRAINAKLLKETNLQDAVSTVYRDKYILAVNGNLYIADARGRYRTQDALDGAYQYEWWFCDGVPARVFAQIDGALYFGTEDGALCVFDDAFADRTACWIGAGQMTIDEDQECIFCSTGALDKIEDGDAIRIYGGPIYSVYATDAVIFLGGYAKIRVEDMYNIREGDVVYADLSRNGYTQPNMPLIISEFEIGEGRAYLANPDGTPYVPSGVDVVRLCKRHDAGEFFVSGVDRAAQCFGLSQFKGGERMDIALYNARGDALMQARVDKSYPVAAEWVTGVTDFGDNRYSKRLREISVVLEPGSDGGVQFGYRTRFDDAMLAAHGADTGFSFAAFSFINFTFDSGFARSYRVPVFGRHVNYAAMRILSNTDKGCEVHSLSMVFDVTREMKGVR